MISEMVNFNIKASLFGLLLGAIFPVVFVFLPFVAKMIWCHEKFWPLPLLFVVFVVSLLVGSLFSELWILHDESCFSAEVNQSGSKMPYSRPRALPNQGCGLVFIPDKGIHSTD